MVSGTAPALTKLSFRRDVRLFLGALVGFLALLVVLLLFMLRSFLLHTEEAIVGGWNSVAAIAADEVSSGPNLSAVELQLSAIRARYGIAGATLVTPEGRQITSGALIGDEQTATVTRDTQVGRLVLLFDDSGLYALRRTFRLTAIISLLAVTAGGILLLLYLPRITRPIEEMLDSASEISERHPEIDEQQYLIQTFRSSIETLKTQKQELQHLHDLQKERADDLARVTASLTRSLTSGFLAVDPAGNVVDLNVAAREILEPRGVVTGLDVREAFGDNDFTTAIRDAVEHRAALRRSEITIERESARLLVGLTTVPLVDEEGRFLGMLALFTDLTGYRELESRVRDLQNLADLGELAGGIAHEFRNALSTILGYHKLARRAASREDAERAVEKSEAEALLLSRAVDQLLGFAKPMTIERQPIDVLDLVRDVCMRFREDGATLECGGTEAHVEGDPALLARALDNIVRNALHSVRQKGSGAVHVTVSGGEGARVVVEDEGVGVDPADVPRLLLPFQSEKPGGYGLGLPLARKIILLHGGSLRFTGRKGAGAVVTVELPGRAV